MALDEQPRVRQWVRNLDSDPVAGFWLPTSFGRFYPDFVCQLTDGCVLVADDAAQHLRARRRRSRQARSSRCGPRAQAL